MKHRVLIVEDDEIFLRPLQRTLEVAGYEVVVVSSGEDAVDVLKSDDIDLVLTDKRLPGIDGVEVVRRIKGEHPNVAVVVMTAYGTIGSAVEAMRFGAEDYLVKPFDAAEILMVLRRAIEFQELKAASRATIRRNQERFTLKNIVARSAVMKEVFDLVGSVAGLDTTVLIHGETGVGKELLARSIHFSGARKDRPFVAVNCAAIPEELFESELFGFRKGAFTGASESRRGLFQMANSGTLLLDEVGEMPLILQSKLLRAIDPAAMQALCRYAWPGNVRELENVIERAVIVAKGDTITDVERFLTDDPERAPVDLTLPFREAKARVVEEFERAYVTGVLEMEGGKLTAAAKHADMDPKNFHEKLTRYGLRRPAAGLGE